MKKALKATFWFVVGLCLYAVSASAQTYTATASQATVTATVSGTTVNWSYTLISTHNATTGTLGTGWMYRVSGNGSTTPLATIFDVAPSPSSTASNSGSFGATSGQWFLLAARQMQNNNNVFTVIQGPNYTWFQVLAQQTVTLSPSGGAGAILTGQTFSGTASGAQAGNSYNISITSGSGGASINPSTGAYTVTAGPQGGLIHYKVWVSAGNGYARSADAEANIAVSLSKKVKVTIPANSGKYPITYKLYQGGVEIGSHTQMPGATAFIVTIDVGANDGPVTMKAFTQGIITDGVVFVDDVSGNVEETLPVTVTPSADPTTPPTTVPPPNTTTPTTTPPKPGGSSGVVWSSTGGAGTDALTNSTYREGVGKIIDTLTGDLPQAESQDSDINTTVTQSTTDAQSVMDAAADVSDNIQTAKTALSDKQPILADVTGSQMVYSFTLAQIGKTWTVDLSDYATPINLMRTVIKVLFMLFMWFLYARTLRSSQV